LINFGLILYRAPLNVVFWRNRKFPRCLADYTLNQCAATASCPAFTAL
jgi:hypothetical protein